MSKDLAIQKGCPRKKESTEEPLPKFNWRRIPIQRGRPKKKEARA